MFNSKLFFLLSLSAALFLYYLKHYNNAGKGNAAGRKKLLPPQVKNLLPFGVDNLYLMAKTYDHVFPTWYKWKEETKSNTISISVLGNTAIVVLDPDSVQHFLVKNWQNYVKGERFIDAFRDLLGDGIFNSNGDNWRFHRNIARPRFQRMELNMMVPTMTTHTKYLLQHLEKAVVNQTSVDIQKYFFQLTLDSACEILFGVNVDSLNDPNCKFGAAFDTLQAMTSYRSTLYDVWKAGLLKETGFKEAMSYMNNFVDDLVKNCYKDEKLQEREDLLAQYIKAAAEASGNENDTKVNDADADAVADDVDKKAKNSNNKQQQQTASKIDSMYLRNMLKNMLIAGRDTTACLLTWCIYELSQHPEVEQKLLDEIEEHVGFDNDTPTGAQLSALKYMKHVLNETLRLHPSVPVDVRTSVEEDWLPNGYYIPPKTDIIYSAYMTQRLPEYWGADAEKFDPDRWEADRIKQIPSFAFVPFHAGPRICLGQNMAYEEAKCALVLILQKYKLSLACKPEEIDYRTIIILQATKMPVNVARRFPLTTATSN